MNREKMTIERSRLRGLSIATFSRWIFSRELYATLFVDYVSFPRESFNNRQMRNFTLNFRFSVNNYSRMFQNHEMLACLGFNS
jgi:hypothetical protein